jgi:hypothetical protein
LYTVYYWYVEICGLRKWGWKKEKGDAGCEVATCFMELLVSEKY